MTPAPILPSFYMPIADTDVSPWSGLAREQMWSWIESFGLAPTDSSRQHLERSAPDLLAARFYPGAGPDLLAISRIPTPGKRIYEHSRQRLPDTLGQSIGKYRNTGTDHGDALSILLAARDADGNFTDDEVIDQLVILFVGGSDTTANTLSWALDLLGRHPDVERRLHDEVDEVLGERSATFTDVANLPWTAQIVTETLRLYPPVAMVTRTVTADTELGGHHIAEGSTLIYSSLAVQHRPDLFVRPEEFDPDRGPHRDPTYLAGRLFRSAADRANASATASG